MKAHDFIKRISSTVMLVLAVSVLLLGGCKSGMFEPRSGEIFQTSRSGVPGPALTVLGMPAWWAVWGFQKESTHLIAIPVGIVGFPLAVVGFVVDAAVFHPLTDIACLPYDLSRPNHGFYIRLVDETDAPIPGIEVECEVERSYRSLWNHKVTHVGKTDAAGEFYVNQLHNLERCWVWVKAPDGFRPWIQRRPMTLKDAAPGSDGRFVFTFPLANSTRTPGGWKATERTQEEVLALLPGKWSADTKSREFLASEIKCPFTDDLARHNFTLSVTNEVAPHIPYNYCFHYDDEDDWQTGQRYSLWKLLKAGVDKVDDFECPSGWKWCLRLSEPKSKDRFPGVSVDFFLGEDQDGVYLAPKFLGWQKNAAAVAIKFRKVSE